MEEGLFHHRQQAFQMLSSALLECKREEALFLSGTLKACSDFRAEVRLQPLSILPGLLIVNHSQTLARDRKQTICRPSAAAPLLSYDCSSQPMQQLPLVIISCLLQAGQMRVVVRDHRNAMACRTSTMIEAQHRCKDLHEEHELQAASFLEQHAELSSALDNSSCEVEQSMQQCLQVLDSVQDMSRCRCGSSRTTTCPLTSISYPGKVSAWLWLSGYRKARPVRPV